MASDTTPTVAPAQQTKPSKPWWLRKRLWLPVGLLAIIVIPIATADDPHRKDVSRAQFEAEGLTWPLTVDAGELQCTKERWVLFTPEGTVDNHSVNGTAKGTGVFSPLEDIWLPDPSVDGLRVNAEDLLDAGLALC